MGKKVGLLSEKERKSTSPIKTKASTTHFLAPMSCVHTGAHAPLTQRYPQSRIEYVIIKYVPR
jgi:hypothetical protein